MIDILKLIFFKPKIDKDIYVTFNGAFGKTSENIFKNKEKSLIQINQLKEIIKKYKE